MCHWLSGAARTWPSRPRGVASSSRCPGLDRATLAGSDESDEKRGVQARSHMSSAIAHPAPVSHRSARSSKGHGPPALRLSAAGVLGRRQRRITPRLDRRSTALCSVFQRGHDPPAGACVLASTRPKSTSRSCSEAADSQRLSRARPQRNTAQVFSALPLRQSSHGTLQSPPCLSVSGGPPVLRTSTMSPGTEKSKNHFALSPLRFRQP
jgi:hypothetical protein